MLLRELEPSFLIVETTKLFHRTDDLVIAHGIVFLCPECFKKNNGAEGTHSIQIFFNKPGTPDVLVPKTGGWMVSGNNYDDLTISPSIQIKYGDCQWHGFVTNGQIK